MVKRFLYILFLLLTFINSSYAATITFENDYGVKNVLLFIFLIALFCFWLFIYRMTEELKFDKRNPLTSVTNFGMISLCWIWFIGIFYMFQGVLFVSSSPTFLFDKLELIYSLLYLTLLIGGILALLNIVKLYNKMTGTTEFIKEFIYDIKTGGKR